MMWMRLDNDKKSTVALRDPVRKAFFQVHQVQLQGMDLGHLHDAPVHPR